ncbi:hypothetical protein ABLG96_13380 [Nakamurella sp. A5-74]|uniref:Esterase n=1 Tax=Nakamurella sp. A5-74 TaxID=3158264 RepID=A0AAU8DKG0_9ACTN
MSAPEHDSSGPLITPEAALLRIPAGLFGDDVTAVDLEVDWVLDGQGTSFALGGSDWLLRVQRPLAHRFEYKVIVRRPGGDEYRTDPTHPRTVPGPFGDKSEIAFGDYAAPAWLGTPPLDREVVLPAATAIRSSNNNRSAGHSASDDRDTDRDTDEVVPVRLITPADLADDVDAPLLLVHDGSDMLERGSLARWAAAQPQPLRLALLDPALGRRNDWYAANDDYADHLASVVIPMLREQVAVSTVIGLGASLGALSMVHLHRRHPHAVDALALQSGSFFTAELDPQEEHWPLFRRVCTAVAAIMAALPVQVRPIPVLMTVGAIEENRSNNEKMAGALAFQGYPVDPRIVPDAHTMIGWRDAWSPGLDQLLAGASPVTAPARDPNGREESL